MENELEMYAEIDEKYAVSNFGEVLNKNTGRILKPSDSNGYFKVKLCNNGIQKNHKIHRLVGKAFIPNPDNKEFLDHIDRNKLNNNVSNLRWATIGENSRNSTKRKDTSSKYKGVCFFKQRNKWICRITINNKLKHLGYFDNQEEAGRKYNAYIIEHKLEQFFVLNKF